MLNNQKIGFIGAGNMATSLIGGLIQSGFSGKSIYAFDANQDRLHWVEQEFAIHTTDNNTDLIQQVDVCVVALKPQVLKQVLMPLIKDFNDSKPLIISVAAGITIRNLESWSGMNCPIIRVMPNTPALVGCGASGLYTNPNSSVAASTSQRVVAESIVEAVGIVAWADTESQIDTITALSGSGPAYFFYMMEVMVKAAIQNGLSEHSARELCIQTALGAAKMANEQDIDLETLRKNVTSPGGTTEQGINAMQDNNFELIMQKTLDAAQQRSIDLAASLGDN